MRVVIYEVIYACQTLFSRLLSSLGQWSDMSTQQCPLKSTFVATLNEYLVQNKIKIAELEFRVGAPRS
jgi:hypothetical protein